MSLIFDRKYRLIVGDPNKTDREVYGLDESLLLDGGSSSHPLESGSLNITNESTADWRTSDKNGVVIEDLQIVATITGTANSTSGSGKSVIKIFNLTKETRGVIENKGNYVILEAGYAQDTELRTVFVGQVEDYETSREGRDLVTKLTCKDGSLASNAVRVTKKFTRDNTYGDILEYCADIYERNGIARGEVLYSGLREVAEDYVQLPSNISGVGNFKLLTGYSATGFLRQVLSTVCDQIGYVSYITNGKLFIHPRGYTKTVEEYSFSSRQMKSIRKSGGTSTNTSLTNGLRGVKIVTFLDGRLDIDKRIKITDGDHQGTYKIITKSHDLDYISGGWDTTITCTEVKT